MQHHLGGPRLSGFGDGLGQGSRAEFHFRLKLLLDHLVAQPRHKPRARLRGPNVFLLRLRQRRAEVDRQSRKPFFQTRTSAERQPHPAANIGGDDTRTRLVNQETCAIEQFHQRAGPGKLAFGKEHQPPAALQILGHAPDRVRRVHVHREGAAVDHDALMKPTDLRRRARSDESPVVLQANADQQPVPPGDMIGQQQHRAGCLKGGLVVGAIAVKQP